HGAPIPTRAGEIEATDLATLADALPGSRLRIRAVQDEEAAELRSMADDGLVPGVSVIVNAAPSNAGEVGLTVGEDGDAVTVPKDLARKIFVVPDGSAP
ncbi:MAG: ferrous iron transport protein A, partial [Gemmatimonadales bacterium]|nr:ferrous iron transport protein A [Gemmatimonadales bacterium]